MLCGGTHAEIEAHLQKILEKSVTIYIPQSCIHMYINIKNVKPKQ